jgi:TonB-dependent starch-binding outer membrane protein SusC
MLSFQISLNKIIKESIIQFGIRLIYGACLLICLFQGVVLAEGNFSSQYLGFASIKNVKISITLKDDDIRSTFKKIENLTPFVFAYDEKDIVVNRFFNESYIDQSVYSVLVDLAKKSNLNFRQINQSINVQKPTTGQQREPVISKQERTVSGIVFDEYNEGLPGANVVIKGTSMGTITDFEGNYRLNIPDENITLVFSAIGYTDQEILIGARSVIDVSMKVDVKELEEVVVMGYGTQIKRKMTSSVSRVDVGKLNSAATNSFEGGLQGIVSGVQVTTSSALGGSAIRVRIRGTSSVSANSEPLYVIDGIPIESGEISTSQPGGGIQEWNLQQAANTNVLASLNPADIESMEVLKDAAAAAIYGSRGANGVVLITTKNGKAGETKVSVSGSFGLSKATHRIDLLNTEQYLILAKRAWYNSGFDVADFWSNSGVLVDGLTQEEAERTDTDWVDQVLQAGKVADYNVSISGGSEKTTFYLSANVKDQTTILKGNKYQRFGTRLNIDHQINEKISVGGRLMLTYIDDKQVPTNWAGGASNVSEMLPIWPVRKEDGSYFNISDEHPVAGNDLRTIHLKSNQILGNWYLKYKIIDGLSLRTELGSNLLFNDDFHFREGQITTHGRSVSSTVNGKRIGYNWKNILNYTKAIDQHSIDLLGAAEIQSYSSKLNSVFGDTFINSTLTRPQDAAIINASYGESSYSFLSYIGRINYDFAGRYLVSISYRADGSSRFGPENRWGYFPAVSLGWVVSDENFFSPIVNTLNFFKIRLSYGLVGNSEIGDYSYLSTYATSTYDANTGLGLANVGDDKLGWETTSQLNVGISFELLQGRISGELDYYNKTTNDLLLPFPVSQMSGVSLVTKNAGTLTNKGYDMMLSSVNIDVNSFQWSTSVTLNYNENMVTSLGDELIKNGISASQGLGSISIFPGYPVGVNQLVEWAGVDQVTGEDTYLDLEGNILSFSQAIEQYGSFANFSQANRKPMGNPWPKYTGGIENRFSYKKFYGSFLFTFATGQTYEDGYMKALTQPFGGNKLNPPTHMLNAWNSPEGGGANVSQLTTSNVFWEGTSEHLYSTDYLRLRDLTIGYKISTNSSVVKGLDLSLKMVNVLTFTKAPDFFWDPEFTGVVQSRQSNNIGAGGAFKQSPQAKSIILGLVINL